MKHINLAIASLLLILSISACGDFDEMNKNPNQAGTDGFMNPNFIMSKILTEFGKSYDDYAGGIISGVVQHTQQDAWSGGYNGYEWSNSSFDWANYYNLMHNCNLLEKNGYQAGSPLHAGIAKLMKAWMFGLVTDLYGDAPYSEALKGAQILQPKWDKQEDIYKGVLDSLKTAYTVLSSSTNTGSIPVDSKGDVFYGGDNKKWAKLAASLIVRYSMRVSQKLPEIARTNIEAYYDKGFASTADNALMKYPGSDNSDSWPRRNLANGGGTSDFERNKMCATLVDKLYNLKDPRIVIFAEPIERKSAEEHAGADKPFTRYETATNTRYINIDHADITSGRKKRFDAATYQIDQPYDNYSLHKILYDLSPTYVGMPPAVGGEAQYLYNLNDHAQAMQSSSANHYVSFFRKDIFTKRSGDFLEARMSTYSDFCFTLAEAALNGWNVGKSAKQWYEDGIKASFSYWFPTAAYQKSATDYGHCIANVDAYLLQPSVAWDGTKARLMDQKWIAGYFSAIEVWMDYLRTGLPVLKYGAVVRQPKLPIRFPYNEKEVQADYDNAQEALDRIGATGLAGLESEKNTAWNKPWLHQ